MKEPKSNWMLITVWQIAAFIAGMALHHHISEKPEELPDLDTFSLVSRAIDKAEVALTPSFEDVRQAVERAKPGMVVFVRQGTAVWTNQLVIDKAIHLRSLGAVLTSGTNYPQSHFMIIKAQKDWMGTILSGWTFSNSFWNPDWTNRSYGMEFELKAGIEDLEAKPRFGDTPTP